MGRKRQEVTEVEFQQSLKVMKKYLIQNGCVKKPYHFKHYILSDCKIGDYLMRVHHVHSETVLTNKLYKVVSGYSYGYKEKEKVSNRHTYFIIIDEHEKEYKVEVNNGFQHWVYFEKNVVEKHFVHELPKDIIEYNTRLANRGKRLAKPKKKETLTIGIKDMRNKINKLSNLIKEIQAKK
jgi:hypothetical protein